MNFIKIRAYQHIEKCLECKKEIKIYYTIPDFGDPPHLMRCFNCSQYYLYREEDVKYFKPLKEQISNCDCQQCGMKLCDTLVEPHRDIKCCNCEDIFSLDDDYKGYQIPDDSFSVVIEVLDLYSNCRKNNDKDE